MSVLTMYVESIPVRYLDPVLGFGSGRAIALKEIVIGSKSRFDFIIESAHHGLVMVWQKYILPEDK